MNHVDNDMFMFACHLNVLINHNCYNSENYLWLLRVNTNLKAQNQKTNYCNNYIVIPIIIIIIDNYYKNMVIDYAVCNTNNIFSM